MAQTFPKARIESAVSRALAANLTILDMGDGFFAVESQSRPGTAHMLELNEHGDVFCPCDAFRFTGLCTHKIALGLRLGTVPASWAPAVNVPIDVQVA